MAQTPTTKDILGMQAKPKPKPATTHPERNMTYFEVEDKFFVNLQLHLTSIAEYLRHMREHTPNPSILDTRLSEIQHFIATIEKINQADKIKITNK